MAEYGNTTVNGLCTTPSTTMGSSTSSYCICSPGARKCQPMSKLSQYQLGNHPERKESVQSSKHLENCSHILSGVAEDCFSKSVQYCSFISVTRRLTSAIPYIYSRAWCMGLKYMYMVRKHQQH